MIENIRCLTCKIEFTPRDISKKYCSRTCYHKRYKAIIKNCVVCNQSFTVAYRFRGTKTCGKSCFSTLMSQCQNKKESSTCLNCKKEFDLIKSRKNSAKYCSYDCFLSTRKSRQSIAKECEYCKKEFKTTLAANRRFCNRSCANSGEFNGAYGKPGTMTGKIPWSKGLTKTSDERLSRLGNKLSSIAKERFSNGVSSHVGSKNPNFGNTRENLTVEKRDNFSKAAVQRILNGSSGYFRCRLTGYFEGKKSTSPVRFKSSWELAIMMLWEQQENIIRYEYEPCIIKLSDGRRSVPDFRVTYNSGMSEFVEVKPTQIQQLQSVKEKLDLTKDAIEQSGERYVLFGDSVVKAAIKTLGEKFDIEVERHKNRQ